MVMQCKSCKVGFIGVTDAGLVYSGGKFVYRTNVFCDNCFKRATSDIDAHVLELVKHPGDVVAHRKLRDAEVVKRMAEVE